MDLVDQRQKKDTKIKRKREEKNQITIVDQEQKQDKDQDHDQNRAPGRSQYNSNVSPLLTLCSHSQLIVVF